MSSEDVINDPLRTMVVLGSSFGSTSSVFFCHSSWVGFGTYKHSFFTMVERAI